MRIAAISDLHLGFGDRADRFGHEVETMHEFLGHLESRHDLIVVVGDTYETWQSRRFGQIRAALDEIRATYRSLSQRLDGPRYRLVSGNHDPIVEANAGTRELEIESHGVTILFTHGHRWDPPLKRTKPLAYTFAWTTGALRRSRRASSTLLDARRRFEEGFLWNAKVPDQLSSPEESPCPYLAGAFRLLEARSDLDVVVCGHTHVPARCETPVGTYLNCGSLSEGCWSWVELDTEKHEYQHHKEWQS